jgi:hypothetical protein
MNKYDYFFENESLIVATIRGHVAFGFSDVPPVYHAGATPEEIAQIDAEHAQRQAIHLLISTNEEKLHEFVNLIGANPDTAFITFCTENKL